jgi:nitroreductase
METYMEFSDIVKQNRSYRRFYEDRPIPEDDIIKLIDMARLTPSAQNLQPLRYIPASDREKCAIIYPSLYWAGYLTEWQGPDQGERPSAYIIILSDTGISKSVKWDHGIAAQTILLGAVSKGYGGCIIGSINKEKLRGDLIIPEEYEIELVIALGHPRENVIVEEIDKNSSIKYYRDEEMNHHVPKRKLQDIILNI